MIYNILLLNVLKSEEDKIKNDFHRQYYFLFALDLTYV